MSYHNRWDGKGYPQGLRGVNIPIEARIFELVDVFDALISRKANKDAFAVMMRGDYHGESDEENSIG
ncbi:MAG: HD domain-containing phosphohydrolase [Desulfomicrobium sp.]|nr:HD domain-containing phosphohydrolase [Desulfomicrobium sp.]MDP3429140.1 HD domain-containing phosphohydrolase [Desulfomicrobium sp.]